MGGYGTWELAVKYPDKFAAIVPICGGGNPVLVNRIGHIPIWVFHGAKDNIVPI
jgi:predicted peptidase